MAGRRFVRWFCANVLPPLPYPVIRGPLRGTRFILGAAAGEGRGASVYVDLVERAKTRMLLEILKPGQVVFDIGANIGYYTLLAARKVGPSGRVVAFEPSARNISYLYRHLTLNSAENVTLVPMACSDRTTLSRFLPGTNCATGRLERGDRPSENGRFECAATVTVDEIVRELRLTPDVLKVDVEGGEEQVLKGAAQTLATARPFVLLGVHSEALRVSCTSYLRGLDYGQPQVREEPDGDAELLFTPATRRAVSET